MGILSRVGSMIGLRPHASLSDAEVRDMLRGASSASGAIVNETTAMRVGAAWRCVNILAGSIATMPLDLIRRVDEEHRAPAVGHRVRRLLTVKPNPWQTPSEFRRMMQAHLCLRGNGYARKVMLGSSIEALIPLHPDRVEPSQDDMLNMVYKVRGRNGNILTFGQKDIFHLRGMSLDGVAGISVLTNMRESLGLAMQTEQAGARLFKNGMLSGGVIKHPGKISENAAANLRKSLDEKYAGAENAGKWVLAEEGMSFEPISLSAEDAQWLGTRDFQRYDIAMFFGVPPHMIGATEKTTSWGTGIEAQGAAFVTYTLNDWIKTWEETIKRDLLQESEWETLDARFNVNGLLRGDVKTRWSTYVQGLQWGVISPDEVRRMEDMNPRADGAGNVYYDPPNTAGTTGDLTNDPSQTPETQRPGN
jgi:HK97 family phage portal protein